MLFVTHNKESRFQLIQSLYLLGSHVFCYTQSRIKGSKSQQKSFFFFLSETRTLFVALVGYTPKSRASVQQYD